MFERLGTIVVVVLGVCMVLLVTLAWRHAWLRRREAHRHGIDARLVSLGDLRLHVFACGAGSPTLVFLAGHGTTCPHLDFKPLWSRCCERHRVAIVERAGYGLSDPSDSPRDVDTVLAQTREALARAGIEGPFVLVAHSMAGLEALRWAQRHPDEVLAIVGLDPVVPDAAGLLSLADAWRLSVLQVAMRLGFGRLMPQDEQTRFFPALACGALNDQDRDLFLAAFHKNAHARDAQREVRRLSDNAATVAACAKPRCVPLLVFVSTTQGADLPGWADAIKRYAAGFARQAVCVLPASHYLHHERPGCIAREMEAFLEAQGVVDHQADRKEES